MAFDEENVKGCTYNNEFITNSGDWVPLALTTVEYPKGKLLYNISV